MRKIVVNDWVWEIGECIINFVEMDGMDYVLFWVELVLVYNWLDRFV